MRPSGTTTVAGLVTQVVMCVHYNEEIMRIDFEYLKNLLEIVLEHDQPDFDLNHEKLKPLWSNDDEEKTYKLIFHMETLEDQNLIESSTSLHGIGFSRHSGGFTISIKPLRLTAQGHQFAADLSKPGVIDQLITSFKEAGPNEVVQIVFALGKKVLEKKLANLIK